MAVRGVAADWRPPQFSFANEPIANYARPPRRSAANASSPLRDSARRQPGRFGITKKRCVAKNSFVGHDFGGGDFSGPVAGALVPAVPVSFRAIFFSSALFVLAKAPLVSRLRVFRASSNRPALICHRAK